ncbi:uncharacterized protein LOC108844722 [Raphanus sativus]|uniref:Uncharacterized protein LOC108844722 n=1 Tax=Raphanus sativus TaxID=3726 RepID=A0A6J0MPS3_RAPSA|nr:uncharacterized protein LOC108844722 [Raphanus sativus]XP_056861586.1 uncharacterized protein LOC108844722 [Raphanus sativus]
MSRRSLTFQSSQPQPLVPSHRPWNSAGFAVSTRPRKSLTRIMSRPSRKRSRKLLTSKRILTSMFLSMESLRETTWLSTLESSCQVLHFTANGWVQSYGSRCVKPPIIF